MDSWIEKLQEICEKITLTQEDNEEQLAFEYKKLIEDVSLAVVHSSASGGWSALVSAVIDTAFENNVPTNERNYSYSFVKLMLSVAGWDICLLAVNCLHGQDPNTLLLLPNLSLSSAPSEDNSVATADFKERQRCNKLCQDLFDLIGKWCNQREITLFNSEHLLHFIFPNLDEIEEELGLGDYGQQSDGGGGDLLEKLARKYFAAIHQYMSLIRLLAISLSGLKSSRFSTFLDQFAHLFSRGCLIFEVLYKIKQHPFLQSLQKTTGRSDALMGQVDLVQNILCECFIEVFARLGSRIDFRRDVKPKLEFNESEETNQVYFLMTRLYMQFIEKAFGRAKLGLCTLSETIKPGHSKPSKIPDDRSAQTRRWRMYMKHALSMTDALGIDVFELIHYKQSSPDDAIGELGVAILVAMILSYRLSPTKYHQPTTKNCDFICFYQTSSRIAKEDDPSNLIALVVETKYLFETTAHSLALLLDSAITQNCDQLADKGLGMFEYFVRKLPWGCFFEVDRLGLSEDKDLEQFVMDVVGFIGLTPTPLFRTRAFTLLKSFIVKPMVPMITSVLIQKLVFSTGGGGELTGSSAAEDLVAEFNNATQTNTAFLNLQRITGITLLKHVITQGFKSIAESKAAPLPLFCSQFIIDTFLEKLFNISNERIYGKSPYSVMESHHAFFEKLPFIMHVVTLHRFLQLKETTRKRAVEENDDDVPSYPSMSVPGFESLFRAPLLRRASELLGAIDDESAASSLPPTKQLNGEQPISDLLTMSNIPSATTSIPRKQIEEEENRIFYDLIKTWLPSTGSSSTQIPKFFHKKAHLKTPLEQLLQETTFQHTLDRKRFELPSNEELDLLWDTLCERTLGTAEEEKRMNYIEFKQIQELLPEKFGRYFKASKFMKFTKDDDNRISMLHFYNYILRKVSLVQARADLGCYDDNYDGFLTEEDLHRYVSDLMPLLNLQNITPSFVKFYICTAVRKFMFFLDPLRRGKIPIHAILLSPILTELFELREPDPPLGFERTNWFSSYSALRIYGQYLNLDVDHNGMLSRVELGKYNHGSLTDVVLDRVFQEFQTYGNEMDYKGFLNFVLAMENNTSPESLGYFFKLLDIEGCGFLNEFTIRYFAKAVIDKMIRSGYDEIGLDDITNEIFDMANPDDHSKITLKDLTKCGVGGTIITILSDVRGFWAYENREQINNDET